MALTGIAYSQARPLEAQSAEDIIERVKRGQFYPADLNRLAKLGAAQAIPVLRGQFAIKKDTFLKAAIASALVRLGERESIYWDFLADHARAAVESDAPSIFLLDSEGRVVRGQGQFSPEFEAWARSHNFDANVAAQIQVYELPNYVTFLALTGDPRGQPLLRRGLASRNFAVQAMAARGLAKLQDTDSIPLIIEACKKVPTGMAPLIARALVFFDDPQAQKAAETFIRDKQVLQNLRRRAQQSGADPFS